MRTYSSGIMVRLGFAVATAITKPDVLILDEVWLWGTPSFDRVAGLSRCQLKGNTAVIFVSHSMEYIVAICDRTMVLDKGESTTLGRLQEE